MVAYPPRDSACIVNFSCIVVRSDLYVQQYLRLCLYNTVVHFHEAKPCKMFIKIANNFNFTGALQDYYCLHMLLAPMKEKKFAYQAWIKVFTAHDYPNVFPQSILIHALSS